MIYENNDKIIYLISVICQAENVIKVFLVMITVYIKIDLRKKINK